MLFSATKLPGVTLIDLEPIADDRGFFARSWCAHEFNKHGLNPNLTQCNISLNRRKATLRGMHYQASPHAEAKLIRVTRGAICDVALDLRSDSPTFKQWIAAELTADNRIALYIPEGCAHGFQALTDDAEILYLMSVDHHPESARGVRWNDPAFAIRWPLPDPILSPRDAAYPDFKAK